MDINDKLNKTVDIQRNDNNCKQFKAVTMMDNNLSLNIFDIGRPIKLIKTCSNGSECDNSNIISSSSLTSYDNKISGHNNNKKLCVNGRVIIPSKVKSSKNRNIKCKKSNNNNSILIEGNVLIFLDILAQILTKYDDGFNDIEYEVNKIQLNITGIVYVNNISTNFMINVHKCLKNNNNNNSNNNNQYYIEFRKKFGEYITYKLFFNGIIYSLHKYFNENYVNNLKIINIPIINKWFNLNNIDYDFYNKFDDTTYNNKDITSFVNYLKTDREINNILLLIYDEIKKNSTFNEKVIQSNKLLTQILNKLKHIDIDIVRISLLILIELVKHKGNLIQIKYLNISKYILPLKVHNSKIIRKYCYKILKFSII